MFTIEQKEAIYSDGAHLIIGAVAGSGKTTTLIGRIVRLLRAGADPTRMLVMMFNKSAAEHFTKKLGEACATHGLRQPDVQTFHAFGRRMAIQLEQRGMLPVMRLVTESYQVRKLAQAALASVNERLALADQLDITADLVADFTAAVEFVKSCSTEQDVVDYLKSPLPSPLKSIKRTFLEAFLEFEAHRQCLCIRTYSDLIYDPVCAIRANKTVADFVADRYEHILVDEFQDVNLAQMVLLKAIAGTRAKVTAVGDDDQAIYVWRGANADYMRTLFEQEFPGARRMNLTHTFRYGHRLALVANHVISHNAERAEKMCIAHSGNTDTLIDVRMARVDSGDPAVVAIKAWLDKGRPLGEAAVLVREYSHSVPIEAALLRHGLPYRIVGAEPFFNRPEVLMLRGCMQLACGGLGRLAPNFRKTVVEAMLRIPGMYLKTAQMDAMEELVQVDPNSFLKLMRMYEKRALSSAGQGAFRLKSLSEGIANWEVYSTVSPDMPAYVFLDMLAKRSKLFEYFTRNDTRAIATNDKVRMVQQVIRAAATGNFTISGLVDYLNELSAQYAASSRASDVLLITSCHRAKGMEWPFVIIPELAERQFPSYDKDDNESIEDERRLFYVAITRARELLLLICPTDALLKERCAAFDGSTPPVEQIVASRFLYEGNLYASALAGCGMYGKPVPACPPDTPMIVRYRTSIEEQVLEAA